MSPRVVLVGPPGAGKSTVATLLARRWGAAVVDTDAMVEAAAGQAIPDIFVDAGEPAFRRLERAAVQAALSGDAPVVSVGGGAVLDPDTEADLRRLVEAGSTAVVFLDVQIADAARRVGLNVSRPLLVGNPRAQWLRLMEARRPVYARVATRTVPTDGRTAQEVADDVAALAPR